MQYTDEDKCKVCNHEYMVHFHAGKACAMTACPYSGFVVGYYQESVPEPITEQPKPEPPSRDHSKDEHIHFDSGAECSKLEARYDLICPTGLRRIAERYGLGAQKYSDFNWCKGENDEIFIRARLNHLINHVNHFLEHGDDGSDDDLAAIAWGAIALMHFLSGCKHHLVKLGPGAVDADKP